MQSSYASPALNELGHLQNLIVKDLPARPPVEAVPPETAIDVQGLSFFYGDKRALNDISLPLYDRRVTAIIGPSGCGKSTLLRTLNRIYELYEGQRAEGSITLHGTNLFDKELDINLLRKDVGMVFQKPTPFPMSIFDNVAYGIRLYERLGKKDLADRVEAALRRAALWDEVKDNLRASGLSLSGGQQQRLCMARALAAGPKVLLLDEPTSALDPISTQKIENLIQDLKKDYTICIVTHNMQQAARLSDYVAFMYMGALIEFSDSWTIFNDARHPKTRDYVAGRFG